MLRQGVMVIRYSVDEDGVSAGGALFFFVCSAVMAITIHVNAVSSRYFKETEDFQGFFLKDLPEMTSTETLTTG